MKKLFLILLAVLCCAGVSAQKAKFGHVDYASIMPLMPGIDTAQTALADMQKELEEEGAIMSQELKQKEDDYMKLVNSGASSAVLKVKEDEFNKLYERFQAFVADGDFIVFHLVLFPDFVLEISAFEFTVETFDTFSCVFHNNLLFVVSVLFVS